MHVSRFFQKSLLVLYAREPTPSSGLPYTSPNIKGNHSRVSRLPQKPQRKKELSSKSRRSPMPFTPTLNSPVNSSAPQVSPPLSHSHQEPFCVGPLWHHSRSTLSLRLHLQLTISNETPHHARGPRASHHASHLGSPVSCTCSNPSLTRSPPAGFDSPPIPHLLVFSAPPWPTLASHARGESLTPEFGAETGPHG
jgi:hypothetical protein